jgi:activator of HSP90 ATPase
MRTIISGFTHQWNDANLMVKEIKSFKGESSVSIRKGKKIVSYDYAITLSWQVDMNDKEGKSIASCSGTYELPEISNEETIDSWEVRVQYEKDDQNLKACLD